jgi:hypothetical protein
MANHITDMDRWSKPGEASTYSPSHPAVTLLQLAKAHSQSDNDLGYIERTMDAFDDWSDDGQTFDPPSRDDPQVDAAETALEDFFDQHRDQVYYERQVEVLFEDDFFHWITQYALKRLRERGVVASALEDLIGIGRIRFYFHPRHRYWERQSKEIRELVLRFSEPQFTKALGDHAETLFDAALPAFGFMPKGRAVTSYNDKVYSATGHNLDRVFERDGLAYGAEIKNTLSYIDIQEYRAKLTMCRTLGLKPLFIVRMAPKSYINETRLLGGYTLVFKFQLYPYGHKNFADDVKKRLGIPADSPSRISDSTIQRFLTWHLKQLKPSH